MAEEAVTPAPRRSRARRVRKPARLGRVLGLVWGVAIRVVLGLVLVLVCVGLVNGFVLALAWSFVQAGTDGRAAVAQVATIIGVSVAAVVAFGTLTTQRSQRRAEERDRLKRALDALTTGSVLHSRSVVGAAAAAGSGGPCGDNEDVLLDAVFDLLWAIERCSLAAEFVTSQRVWLRVDIEILFKTLDRITDSLRVVLNEPGIKSRARVSVAECNAALERFPKVWEPSRGVVERALFMRVPLDRQLVRPRTL